VGILGELATLGCVEVDVVGVYVESTRSKIDSSGTSIHEGAGKVELDVELDLVVLEGDEGNGKTWVAAEPEAHGDVGLCGCG